MHKLPEDILKHNPAQPEPLTQILDALTDPVIIYNAAGIMTKANQAARDFLQSGPAGLPFPESAGKKIPDLSNGETDTIADLISKALKGESIKNIIYRFQGINGTERFHLCSAAPLCSQNTITGAVLCWHDITAAKAKEQQLERSNKKLKNLVNAIKQKQKLSDKQIKNDQAEINIKDSQIMVSNKLLEIIFSNTHFLIAYLATDFTFIQVNDAYAKAFSRTPDFFIGKNHFTFFPHATTKAIFENVVKTGESYITYADPLFHSGKPEPGITYWDWSLKPIKNNHAVEGIILVLIDVTRRKKAEEDLFNAKRLSDIGTLAATVAHELRNPLGVIQAAIYNINRKSQHSEIAVQIAKHIANINAKVEESEQIINNLLSYSRVKLPKHTEISIYDFLNELFDDIGSKNSEGNLTFHRDYEALQDTFIRIDPFQIREVLNNLVNNACQALLQQEGCIEIRGSLSGNNQLLLEITDNGDGIAEEDLEKIFNPFFTKRSRGTGLGLTICKELIKLHKGSIEIQSHKGQGTTVKITLPLKEGK